MHTNYNFLQLLQISDSYFPIGSFTLSNGLETYIQKEVVMDIKSLEEYIKSYLYIFKYNDLAFLKYSYEYYDDIEKLKELDSLCSAAKSPSEIRKGSIKLCGRFIKVTEHMGSYRVLQIYKSLIRERSCLGHHCIAFGIFTRENNIDMKQAMMFYAYSTISAIINNAVKMVPLSQLAGQGLLSKMLPDVIEAVELALEVNFDELGICGVGFDIRAMQHEKLYSRVYIS